jgi:hypothetical protein
VAEGCGSTGGRVEFARDVWVGSRQIDEARNAQDNDRFEKALTRLASKNSTERLTGISGLRIFLDGSNQPRDTAIVRFLVDALATEQDLTVPSAIVDSFSTPAISHLPSNTLNEAFAEAIERNRSLLRSIVSLDEKRFLSAEKTLVRQFLNLPVESANIYAGLDKTAEEKLSDDQKKSLSHLKNTPFSWIEILRWHH